MTSPADYVVILSRLQFAITTLFHILWPVLTIGLSLFLVVTEFAMAAHRRGRLVSPYALLGPLVQRSLDQIVKYNISDSV